MGAFNTLPLRRVSELDAAPMDRGVWPATIPAVRQLLDEGLNFESVTVLVGENGSGKSTITEAIAEAYGLGVQGGTQNVVYRTQQTESPLSEHLLLTKSGGFGKRGVFLRSETMHGHFGYLHDIGVPGEHNFQSHGESFIEYFSLRGTVRGLWIFDEAESALSFGGCLTLIMHIQQLVAEGSQVILATHSPLLAAIPGQNSWSWESGGSVNPVTTNSRWYAVGACSWPLRIDSCGI